MKDLNSCFNRDSKKYCTMLTISCQDTGSFTQKLEQFVLGTLIYELDMKCLVAPVSTMGSPLTLLVKCLVA